MTRHFQKWTVENKEGEPTFRGHNDAIYHGGEQMKLLGVKGFVQQIKTTVIEWKIAQMLLFVLSLKVCWGEVELPKNEGDESGTWEIWITRHDGYDVALFLQ